MNFGDSTYTPRLCTVAQFASRHSAFSQAALRNLILYAEDRKTSCGAVMPGNGLATAGAIVRIGRRVLIDEDKFFQWVADQQMRRPARR